MEHRILVVIIGFFYGIHNRMVCQKFISDTSKTQWVVGGNNGYP
jgi:hypothetical protein